MKKRYFWIYVLPVLMVTTIIGFGVLGVKSAVNQQQMEEELAKIEWKMEPARVLSDHRPFYYKDIDVAFVICKGQSHFSTDPIMPSMEEVDARYEQYDLDDEGYWLDRIDYGPEQTGDNKEIIMDAYGEQVGTVKIVRIDDWSDKYVCGSIDGKRNGVLNYGGRILIESEEYEFGHLYGNLCYKRPYYDKADDTVVFDIVTGETIYRLEGDWLVDTTSIGYCAADQGSLTRESDVKIYFDREFQELTRIEKGNILIGPGDDSYYWYIDSDGGKRLLDENLQVKKDYQQDLLAYTEFSEGLSLLYFRDKLVCIDENLNVVFEKKAHIPIKYADDTRYDKNSVVRGVNIQGFHDGLAVFTLDGRKYGVLDSQGNVWLEPVFKGKDTLTVMKNQHIGYFYQQGFCIGKFNVDFDLHVTGGEKNE